MWRQPPRLSREGEAEHHLPEAGSAIYGTTIAVAPGE